MRHLWFAPLLALLPITAPALEVYLAPLAFVDESGMEEPPATSPQEDLLQALQNAGLGESLAVRQARPNPVGVPGSLLEAIRLCEQEGYPYLLYGYLRRTAYAYSAELKLLDRERRQIAALFFAGDDNAHYDRLIRDVAAKVLNFLHAELGLEEPQAVAAPQRNQLAVAACLGYWTPLGGDWDRVMAGVASIGVAARFIPANPLFRLGTRDGYLALGLDAEYGLGMNEPGYESFFLHSVRFRIPVEARLVLPAGHSVGIGIGLLVEVDTAVQDRLYASLFTGTTIIPGGCVSLSYHYTASERVSLGITNLFEVAAYSPVLFVFSPRVVVSFTAGSTRKGDGHE